MKSLGLSGRQIVDLSKQLRSRYAVLWQKVSSQDEFPDAAVSAGVHDVQDESHADEQEEDRLAEMRHDRQELADIEEALARIHGESYGLCSDCGAPIGYPRLEAYPTAKRCLPCQVENESQVGTASLLASLR